MQNEGRRRGGNFSAVLSFPFLPCFLSFSGALSFRFCRTFYSFSAALSFSFLACFLSVSALLSFPFLPCFLSFSAVLSFLFWLTFFSFSGALSFCFCLTFFSFSAALSFLFCRTFFPFLPHFLFLFCRTFFPFLAYFLFLLWRAFFPFLPYFLFCRTFVLLESLPRAFPFCLSLFVRKMSSDDSSDDAPTDRKSLMEALVAKTSHLTGNSNKRLKLANSPVKKPNHKNLLDWVMDDVLVSTHGYSEVSPLTTWLFALHLRLCLLRHHASPLHSFLVVAGDGPPQHDAWTSH